MCASDEVDRTLTSSKDWMPPRCVLNGLKPVPIPVELAKLDALSAQLIQLAKCYQIISKTKNVI